MARAVSAEVSEIYARLHTERGVVLRLGSGVAGFTSTNGRVSGITLSDGHNVSTDLVLMGIGILPNQELAEAAGISCASGIIIDSCGRTSDPFVFACGDCTATRLENGDFRRLESVQNAIEQAKSCAASIMNRERPLLPPRGSGRISTMLNYRWWVHRRAMTTRSSGAIRTPINVQSFILRANDSSELIALTGRKTTWPAAAYWMRVWA